MGVILIIDDDYQIRESFEKLLTEEGHEVLTAASGETGLDRSAFGFAGSGLCWICACRG